MKLGILGGMGPLATADFFKKVILMTKASTDQDHIRILMDDNPQIPDRSAYILGKGKDPTREMIRSAIRLEYMGADFIAMPCNTAHKFISQIQAFLNIPILNMIELTADYLKQHHGKQRKALLLATEGTYTAGLYNFALNARGIELITPSQEGKDALMQWIYEVKKSGEVPQKEVFSHFIDKETGGENIPIILGCTELPLIIEGLKMPETYIDTTTVLAKACVVYANKKKGKTSQEGNIA